MRFIKNRSKKYYDGSRHLINDGWVTVIGRLSDHYVSKKGIRRYNKVYVEFDNGYKCITSDEGLRRKNIKNPYNPSVFNIGYLGEQKQKLFYKGKMIKEYVLWHAMMARCYDPTYKKDRPWYNECKVHSRWHNLAVFMEDIKTLKGYDNWKKGEGYQLDKDLYSDGEKVYSKDTCCFLSPKDNNCYNAKRLKRKITCFST